mmetsp:Transcript_57580/g.171353  ORF Transcript_57580/g.171353 Transcript_57580/m.171353 type:complete len:187 (+) Transcript_57580:123-683(+)
MAVFVNGFDFDTPEGSIAQHFETIGCVLDVKLVSRGAAVVRFENLSDAERAVQELHETTIPGNRRFVTVRLDGKGGGGGKGGKKGKDVGDRGKGGGKRFEDRTSFDGEYQMGTVAKFFTDRGFGYITPDGGGQDVFVHFSAIRGTGFRELAEGQRVSFGVEPDPKGKGKGKGKRQEGVRAVAVSVL